MIEKWVQQVWKRPWRSAARGLLTMILGAGMLVAGGCEKGQESPGDSAGTTPGAAGGEWRLAGAFSSTLPLMGESGVRVGEAVARISGGRLRLTYLEPGTAGPVLEIFNAVGRGDVEAGWGTAAFWSEQVPAAAFFTAVPFGPDTNEFLAWLYHGGGLELWRELYFGHNVHPLPCGAIPPEAGGWFREPLAKPEQLKGRKIRFFGLGGQALQKLGASVLNLDGGDLYAALERGVLDGSEFSLPLIDQKAGFGKVAKYYQFPGWHQQTSLLELIVNRERWTALPEVDRLLLETVCRASIVETLAEGEASQRAALTALRQEGVEVNYWSDEMLQAFKRAYEEVVQEMSAKDEPFRRTHDSYLKFREGYKEWAKLSRLPPGY